MLYAEWPLVRLLPSLSTARRYMGRRSHGGGDVDFSLDHLSPHPSDMSYVRACRHRTPL